MDAMDMNTEIARKLCAVTSDFYRQQATSFSSTRHTAWAGWERCLQAAREQLPACEERLSVLDLACGNLRFEDFIAAQLPQARLSFHAVDNCDALAALAGDAFGLSCAGAAASRVEIDYQSLDVMDALFNGPHLEDALRAPVCDMSVSFGFMHHVPLASQRRAVLDALVGRTRPGGVVAVSFWRFLNSPQLADKARFTHERALAELGLPPLGEGDFLLGWKNLPGAWRYCHNFTDAEVDDLAAFVASRADVLTRFAADGRTGNLNDYLVLRVR